MDVQIGGEWFRVYLMDDGTLDTVVQVCDEDGTPQEYRYSQETAADYRNEDGYLDFETFVTDVVSDDID